ncbi:class I adenylate-forming enzyme family protein [Blastomonas fulva]|uniref:class I adenylate-forming enzyme family protein n=1 Tax=Blastomonas fulva TaxID=1550728 RepID=UPI003F71F303
MASSGFTGLTVGRGIRCAAAAAPQKIALDDTTGKSLTYAALTRRMDGLGLLADKHGLGRGDIVALIAPNCMEYLEIVAGLSEWGIVVATLNPMLSAEELRLIFDDCVPRLVIAASQVSLPPNTPAHVRLGEEYEAAILGSQPQPRPDSADETDTFAIAYTSGTTGKPKGVLLPHRSRCLMFGAMAVEYGCFGRDSHFMALAPMCHGAGLAFALAPIYNGGRCTLVYSADPAHLLDAVDRFRPDGIFVVPTHLHRIFSADRDLLERYRGRHSLKAIISNAAALSPALKHAAVDYFGEGLVHETYGSTEAGIVANIRPRDMMRKPRSVGQEFCCMQIELRHEDGTIAAPSEPGELFCRGPYTFNGYLNRPEDTAATIIDGWVTVGDIAVRDDDGFITITDRKKDMIITGGMNVYPREIESVIEDIAGVMECAVVGQSDQEWGESITAFVVAPRSPQITVQDVLAACRARLVPYKVPKKIVFLDEMPKNNTGKLLKRKLRENI